MKHLLILAALVIFSNSACNERPQTPRPQLSIVPHVAPAELARASAWFASWAPIAVEEHSLSLTDRMHLILAFDQDANLPRESASMLGDLQRSAIEPIEEGRMPWLIQTPNGWAVRALRLWPPGSNGEAHPAQFLCYLAESPRVSRQFELRDGLGQRIDLSRLADSYPPTVGEWSSMEYLIPALLAWSDKETWISTAGRTITLGQLVQQHLKRGPELQTCHGAHWYWTLAKVWAASSKRGSLEPFRDVCWNRLDARIQNLVKSVGAEGELVMSPMEAGNSSQEVGIAERVSFNAHTIAWWVDCHPETDQKQAEVIKSAMEWTLRSSIVYAPEIPLSILCHVQHAIRKYEQWCASLETPSSQPTLAN